MWTSGLTLQSKMSHLWSFMKYRKLSTGLPHCCKGHFNMQWFLTIADCILWSCRFFRVQCCILIFLTSHCVMCPIDHGQSISSVMSAIQNVFSFPNLHKYSILSRSLVLFYNTGCIFCQERRV